MAQFDIELVGKVGSMALVNKKWSDVDYNVLAHISRQLRPGYIWVTSGATEIGRIDYIRRTGKELKGAYTDVKSDYAAQGQAILMESYRRYVNPMYGIRQILVEHQHFNDDAKAESLKQLLLRCPEQGAIPIVNYNDPLSNEEIVKTELQVLMQRKKHVVHCADNDETAAQIADLVKCKHLLIYTSTDGIYRVPGDPSTLIPEIKGKDDLELIAAIDECQKLCDGSSRVGAAGARAKLEYIKSPVANGTRVYIASPKYDIKDILSGDAPCTRIFIA